jgi:hypothetical protein
VTWHPVGSRRSLDVLASTRLPLASVLVPASDAAVYVQTLTAAIIFAVGLWLSRGNRSLMTFVGGLAILTAAGMALRTLH